MIPETILQTVQQSLEANIQSVQSVSGGSINQAAKVTLADGRTCFLKWNTSADPDLFLKEKRGLQLLKSANTPLRIPDVLAAGKVSGETGFLVQEFITEGPSRPDSAQSFGQFLAELHRQSTDHFGLDHDNYIGKLPQFNQKYDNWTEFFIEQRMEPQLRLAVEDKKLTQSVINHFENMYSRLDHIFPNEQPALLHGDLWGGNYFYDEEGQAAIYDPAVYYGHREIELAFTHLFGGFAADFYRSYETNYPLEPHFSDRKDIYNLYPLLVHTNLFGRSYARQVEATVKRF